MANYPRCPCCGQETPDIRVGVRLSPLKARLFDAIRRAGPDGIYTDDLFDMFMRDRNVKRVTLKAHLFQINEALAETDYSLKCSGGRHSSYSLVRTESM